ncbi:SusC/RagA family TonB-linked outer membrane protein [Zobellia uliginosa]|uniref:SusC/RagA family TonB-linked outer membrane protein n=1 Tax=Zobellia uliginosa TaxID=143224 RepID=UPI0026E3CCEB|nr:TonB-dependent receptor [Zobellia uliginosa]MDO6517000.1 TonB-dependent receptor [Zobellia uliginosa]
MNGTHFKFKNWQPHIYMSGLLWLLIIAFGHAQEISVSGTVSDDSGLPLAGANVLVKGTTSGTQTDFDGNYTISAEGGATLVFSYIGFTTKEVAIDGQNVVNVTLSEDASQLEEVVVIGYGTQKKSDLTGSVSTVDSEEINKFTYNDAAQAIQGRTAGVRVEANGGSPGANALVTIRGSSTLSDAGPLYVIDGMLTGDMTSLNPGDIESISVLKDASASAIYGSRAANGVIIVTTKKGTRDGGIKVDLDYSYGLQSSVKNIDWANARDYATIVNRARDNDGNDRFPANDTQFNPNIDSDIQRESLRTAGVMNANARIYGGTEHSTYSLSFNHYDQEGIVKQSDYKRTTARVNATLKKGRFKLENTIGLTRSVDNPNPYFNKERDLIPTIAIYDSEGNFSATDQPLDVAVGAFYGVGNVSNSLGLATVEDRTITRNSILGNIAGSFEIIDGLTYKLNLGLDYYTDNNYRFTPTYVFNTATFGNNQFAELAETNTNFLSTLIEHTLTYSKEFNKHNVNLVGGYTDQVSNTRSLGALARKFPSNDVRIASAAEDKVDFPSEDLTKTIQSYFGRLSYVYDSRYLLTATIRRDGSSLFKEDLRWGTFPSIALGWNLSNESFMEDVTLITNIKLRGSYGEVGSDNVPIYSIDRTLNVNSEYPLGESQNRAVGYSITKGINEDITWETSKTTDIGLEFRALDQKLSITMDYFQKKSEDVLVELGLPLYTGFGNRVPFNTASIENQGFEFLANYSDNLSEDFSFSISGNFTTLNNEVTALGDATPIIEGQFTSNGLKGTKTDVGQPVSSFFGYIVDGIYQTDAEALAANDNNNPQAGDLRFKDIAGPNGSGPDGIIDDNDQTFLGSPAPNFEYGLNISASYKNLDLSLFFNGVSGNKILNANRYRGYFDTEGPYLTDALRAWTPTNTNTDIPRNTQSDPGFNRRPSDFYLENGAYFRLKNMQIGYTVPSEISERMMMTKLRIYGSATNLFTLTDYTGYYPEVGRNTRSSRRIFSSGVDESAYPTARTVQLGVQISF